MTKKKFLANEKREQMFAIAGYRCAVCGESVYKYGTPQSGHIIPKGRIRIYGEEVIHHIKNQKPTCSLYCNGRVGIGCSPEEEKALVAEILEEIENDREI